MRLIGLLRMAKWARKPPSAKMVRLGAVVLALCLVLLGIEYIFGWPDALTPNQTGRLLRK